MQHRIIYACDDNYAPLTAISAVSLLQHNPGCEIVLLGCNLSERARTCVKERVTRAGGTFRHLDVSTALSRLETLGAEAYVSYAVYARIFIPDLMADAHGKVLYLDCDTLIRQSLDELFETDLSGNPLALAPDAAHPAYKRVIALPSEKTYFNSGVALIDLDSWRKRNCTERLLEELRHPHGRNPLGDQDIIVRVLNDEILPLPVKWNFLSQYYLQKRRETPAICHFSGHTLGRPWFTSSKHPLRQAYREAARAADLPDAAEQQRPMSFEYKLQYWLYRLLPQFLFKPVCNLMYRTHIRVTYGI